MNTTINLPGVISSDFGGQTTGRIKNSYLYDADHRLRQTTNFMYTPTRVKDNYSSSYSYDMAGNLTSLTRNGFLGMDINNDPTYGVIDLLIYTYNPDLFLTSVENDIGVASVDYGFKGEISGYDYDDRGNMITSTLNDLSIQYNPINLPGVISSDFGGQTTGRIKNSYLYDADYYRIEHRTRIND
jgi:hypothetical protein